jgi:hypothetical protein
MVCVSDANHINYFTRDHSVPDPTVPGTAAISYNTGVFGIFD